MVGRSAFVDDDQARARHDDDEAWARFMGRRRDSTRRRRRRDLGFAWALLLGTFAVGVLVGLLVGRIGGNQEERLPRLGRLVP